MAAKKITPKTMREMAEKLLEYLIEDGLFSDISIYAGGMRYSDLPPHDRSASKTEINGTELYISEYPMEKVANITEYNNPKTLTVIFEGPLYDAINYGNGSVEEKINEIFKPYGLYMEQGNAWNLAAYEI